MLSAGQSQTLQVCHGSPMGQAASSGSRARQRFPVYMFSSRLCLCSCPGAGGPRRLAGRHALLQHASRDSAAQGVPGAPGGRAAAPADCAEDRCLEALRLEDPASMSGCWNPGCAAAFVMADIKILLKNVHLYALACKPADCAACWHVDILWTW